MITGPIRRMLALLAGTALVFLTLPTYSAAGDQSTAAGVQRYVALGDSFSAGDSVRPYEPATNRPSNRCHRSKNAYPNQLADENPHDIELISFRACSGATTSNVTTVAQYPTQPPQVAAFPTGVDLVSITIGGNDIGFGDFVEACVLRPGCGGPAMVNAILDNINNVLPGLLSSTYASIRAAAGPRAEVFVLGYPQIVGAVRQGGGCPYLTGTERPTIRHVVVQLNAVIRQASVDAGFGFVDPTAAQSPFLGHEVCTPNPFFTNITSAAPFHPNLKGQGAYEDLLTDALAAAGILGS